MNQQEIITIKWETVLDPGYPHGNLVRSMKTLGGPAKISTNAEVHMSPLSESWPPKTSQTDSIVDGRILENHLVSIRVCSLVFEFFLIRIQVVQVWNSWGQFLATNEAALFPMTESNWS